jgi:hypothetical protein
MATRVPFGAATVENGKNKGAARTIRFATGISKENANGLPVEGDRVMVELSAAAPKVIEFSSADEVRQFAGEHIDAFLLDAANSAAKAAVRTKLTTEFRKLTLSPSDLNGFVNSLCDSITETSLFEPTQRSGGGRTGIKQELATLQSVAEKLSKEELLAAISKLLQS